MTCSCPPPEEGPALARSVPTAAPLLLLFSALNPRRKKAESISTPAYLLLLLCATPSGSVTRWTPGNPQLSPRLASFFSCKKQQENKLESYPYQGAASCLLFPVQTVEEIKPQFRFRGHFRPEHDQTDPAWAGGPDPLSAPVTDERPEFQAPFVLQRDSISRLSSPLHVHRSLRPGRTN